MPKYRLIRDLPFQKADDMEWEPTGTTTNGCPNCFDNDEPTEEEKTYTFESGEKEIEWNGAWGDPLTSGWFEEVKQKKWRAEKGENYYCIDDDMLVFESKETGYSIDNLRFESNNYFRTQEQATEAANRIKKLLAEYQEEINKE